MEFRRWPVCIESNKQMVKSVVRESSLVISIMQSRGCGSRQKLLLQNGNNLSAQFINLDRLEGRKLFLEENMIAFDPRRLESLKR